MDILARKLRMFEMVIGECGTVLGHLASGRSFEQMLVDVWLRQSGEGRAAKAKARRPWRAPWSRPGRHTAGAERPARFSTASGGA